MPVIAIDGPGGAGKSTVARELADRLGLCRLDTGAMYRAVTYEALRRGIAPHDAKALGALADTIEIGVGDRVFLNGEDVTLAIRSAEVTATVSQVAAHPPVRNALVAQQREWVAAKGGGIVEGRDIGSVVLPGADLKIFLTASPAERAARRAGELGEEDPTKIAAALGERDRLDAQRPDSPLVLAPGAVLIDTTGRPIEAVIEEVLALL